MIIGRKNPAPENGYIEEYHDVNKTNLYRRGSYLNGMREGYWEIYFSNRKLMYRGIYDAGREIGFWEFGIVSDGIRQVYFIR